MTLTHALAHWLGWNMVRLDVIRGWVVCECGWRKAMDNLPADNCGTGRAHGANGTK